MNRLLWLTPLVASFAQAAWAQDIVYSSAPLAIRDGAFYPTGPAHLYRITLDGKPKGQLTNADYDDTDPCLSPDKQRILFLRRDRMDRIGLTWLCSIRLDGTGLAALWRFPGQDVTTPAQMLDQAKKISTSVHLAIGGFKERRETKYGIEEAEDTRLEWLDAAKTRLIYQLADKTPDSSWPVIYEINAATRKWIGKLGGVALEDVDPKQSLCLVSKWRWGRKRNFDGALPLGSLALWQASRGFAPIPMPPGTCQGACFCASAGKVVHPAPGPAPAKPVSATGPIIFSASRYGDRFQVPYRIDNPHLYSVRSDGTGLKQLTIGNHFDAWPSLSKDGHHILFWRTRSGGQYPTRYRLYRMALDGSAVQSLGLSWSRYSKEDGWHPLRFEANSFELFRARKVRPSSMRAPDYSFSPDGRRALGGDERQKTSLIDFASGVVRPLDPSLLRPAWLDRNTIVALRETYDRSGDRVFKIVYVGLNGRVKARSHFPGFPVDDFEDLVDTDDGDIAYSTGSKKWLLWQFHKDQSDGGYDWSFLFGPKGLSRDQIKGTIEAVSPSEDKAIFSQWEWFGGYKFHGAEKLCRLEIHNLRTGEKIPFGPRRMECYGACWVR